MFSLEDLKKIEEKYYEIYLPFIQYDFFSLLYDTSENEWCYTIDENITKEQLEKVKRHFEFIVWIIYGADGKGLEGVKKMIKHFTINDYIDNCKNMMDDKDLMKLYEKFDFMYESFLHTCTK